MRSFLIALSALFTVFSFAQQYNVKSYSVDDGLAISQVKDICQDEHGYLWIGTASGLSRYDGVEFKNYFMDDGLIDNKVRTIYISEKGNLWVATLEGISFFDQQKFISYKFNDNYLINDIFELQGEMYLGSSEHGLIQLKNGEFIRVGQEQSNNYRIREGVTYKDSIVICATTDGLHSWNGEKFDRFLIPGYDDESAWSVDIHDHKLYVTARFAGLFSYDLLSGEVINYDLNINSPSDVVVSDNSIFGISKNSGAFLIRDKDTLYFGDSNGLIDAGLECLFKDKEENIWMGTNGSGLLRLYGTSVVYYTTRDSLGSDLITSVAQDTSGGFIFGTYDNGVTLFRSNGIEYISSSREGVIFDNTVWITFQDSLNRTWIGTQRGLSIIDEDNQPVEHVLQDERLKIRTMALAGDGKTMLLAGNKGLIVMTEDTIYKRHPQLNINKLYTLNGEVYCGTRIRGLYKIDSANYFESLGQFKSPPATINALTSDFRNNLWIGTENGLYVMHENQNIFRVNLFERNNQSKNILGLITASDGSVWASGMQGVYQVVYDVLPKTSYSIKNYGKPEGLIDEETNINSLYEDDKGNIWIGTAHGLAKIDPAASESLFRYELPMLHITGMRLFMEEFNYSDYTHDLDSVFNVPTSIELPHDKNHLTFDFIGINLKNPDAVQYEYRLIGVNELWSPVSRSNYATYSFLQPGEYTFQVRAMNKSRKWSEIQEVNFIIHTPFWKSWWFIALMVLSGLLIIVYIFQSRIRVLKQKQDNEKLDLKNRLLFLEQRSLNASMNRHFIFNSLNSIQYFINSSNKRSANKFLSNFAKLIRMNLDSSAANNFIVTLQEEIERIELYLGLEKMRFSDKFEFKIDVSSSLDTESIEIPSMILQPFVENSIIHGVLSLDRMGQISVKVFKEFGEVVFEVTDNGIGIDNSLASKGNQISGDHESKGVEITNRRIEILRRLTGENLLIIGPFQMNGNNGECLGTKVVLKLGGSEKFQE